MGLGFHGKPAFFCNVLNGDLYIDSLITELFQICLVVNQNLGEGTLWNVFVGVLKDKEWEEEDRTALSLAL